MAVLLAFVLLGGISLLIVDGIFVLLWMGDLNAARGIRRTEPTPVGSWRPRTGRVAAEGITDFGPGGRQIAPVSGEVCAWFHVTTCRWMIRSFGVAGLIVTAIGLTLLYLLF